MTPSRAGSRQVALDAEHAKRRVLVMIALPAMGVLVVDAAEDCHVQVRVVVGLGGWPVGRDEGHGELAERGLRMVHMQRTARSAEHTRKWSVFAELGRVAQFRHGHGAAQGTQGLFPAGHEPREVDEAVSDDIRVHGEGAVYQPVLAHLEPAYVQAELAEVLGVVLDERLEELEVGFVRIHGGGCKRAPDLSHLFDDDPGVRLGRLDCLDLQFANACGHDVDPRRDRRNQVSCVE